MLPIFFLSCCIPSFCCVVVFRDGGAIFSRMLISPPHVCGCVFFSFVILCVLISVFSVCLSLAQFFCLCACSAFRLEKEERLFIPCCVWCFCHHALLGEFWFLLWNSEVSPVAVPFALCPDCTSAFSSPDRINISSVCRSAQSFSFDMVSWRLSK